MKYPFHPTQEHLVLSTLLAALGDSSRLRILHDLARSGEKCCGDFEITSSKSTLSHHLKVMREAGVISTRIDGTKRFISLRWDDLEARFPGLIAAILNAPRRAPRPHTGHRP